MDGEDIPSRISNIELAKIVKEQMAERRVVREENRAMRREIDKLKGQEWRGYQEESEEGHRVRQPNRASPGLRIRRGQCMRESQ